MNASASISVLSSIALCGAVAGKELSERLVTAHENFLENRRGVLSSLSDPFGVPLSAKVVLENPKDGFRSESAWKRNVVATVFWVGEQPTQNNPVPNDKSAWDTNWQANFGGYDDPNNRDGYFPKDFLPGLNPFYVALPYNDIGKDFRHRAEASEVIPWFWERYQGEGISVCKGRWIAIHHEGKICYAQWEDVGPFETDHWQYVFGNENARMNRNAGAGLDVSPAVRDHLGMDSGQRVEWKFVEEYEVPQGPWKLSDFRPGNVPGEPELPAFPEPALPTR